MEKARKESLVKWINKLEGSTPCLCLEELASGEILLERMRKIIPELQGTNSRNPWDSLLQALEDFCDCVPSKFLHIQSLSQGDVEQIGRVVVIFLCMAVQKKPNEDIIAGITSLDPFAQRDIMFFIENTLGKMETHALMSGEFTSGIGHPLPPLDEPDGSVPSGLTSSSAPESQPDVYQTKPAPPLTPSRPATKRPAYDGLASPAAARWLLTPVMAKKGRPISDATLAPTGEEVLVLRHKVRVLEKRLETESKMARDFHTDLCQLSKEHEYLKVKCSEAERKAKQARNVQDLEDELEECRQKLCKAEKALGCLQDEMETLATLKKRCCELEKRVLELEPAQAQLQECQTRVEHLNTLLGEQRAQMKQQQLHFGTLEVQLKIKSEQLENSIQQVAKLSEEVKDMQLTQRLARETEVNLEREKELLQEKLQNTMVCYREEKQEATMRMDELRAQVESQHGGLKCALATIETFKAQLEENGHQILISEQQMMTLCSQHEREVVQLQGELQQTKLQCRKVTEEAQRVTTAILGYKEATKVGEESGSVVVYNLKQVESLWSRKLQELSSLQEQCVIIQESLGEAVGAVGKLEGDLKESRHDNSLLKESLSKAQHETREIQANLQRVAKGSADLKVSNSLLEVQLEQSRDEVELALKKKASVEENLLQANELNCVLESELSESRGKCLRLESDLKCALEHVSAVQDQLTRVSKQLAVCEEELAAVQKAAKEQIGTLNAELVGAQEANQRLQDELQQSFVETAHFKSELLVSQEVLAKTVLEHQEKSAQLLVEWEHQEKSTQLLMEQQKGHLNAEHESRMKQLQTEQQERNEQLQALHASVIEQLKTEYEANIKSLQSEQEKTIEQLQRRHGANLEHLQAEHGNLIEQLKSGHEMEIIQLKSEQEKAAELLQAENKKQLHTEYEKVIAQLKSENGSMVEQLRSEQEKMNEQLKIDHALKIDQLRSEHGKMIDNLESEYESVIEQLKLEQEKMIDQSQRELTLTYEAIKSLEEETNKKLQEAYGNVTATQVELAQVHDQLVSSREEVASLTEQLVSSRKEVASLTEQLVSSNKEVTSLTEQLVSSNKEVTSLTEQLVSSNKEVASLTEQNKLNTEKLLFHLRETEAALQSRDRDVATLDGKMQAITEHKNKVEGRNVELETKQQQLETELVLLERQNEEDSKKFQYKLEETQEILKMARNQTEELKKELQLLVEQKSKSECEHIAITQELNLLLDDAKAQIVELIHQKELTEEQLSSTRQKLIESEDEHKRLLATYKFDIETKEGVRCQLLKQLEDAQREINLKEEGLSCLQKELLLSAEQMKETEAKCTELEAYSVVLEDERTRLESEGKARREEHLKVIQSLQTELEHAVDDLRLLTDAKLQLEMEIANAQHQVIKNNQTMAELNFSYRTLQDENTRHREQCKVLEMQLKKTSEQLDNEKSVHNDVVLKLETKCSECGAELATLKDKLSEQCGLHQKQCDELQKENCALLKRNSQLHEELQHIQEAKHEADRMCVECKEAYVKQSEKVQQLFEYKEAYTLEAEKVQELLQYKNAYIRELDKAQQLSAQITAVQNEKDEQASCLSVSLAKEQKQTAKLVVEVQSLQTHLAYAEQRLRDIEHGRNQVILTSNPSLHCQHAAKPDGTADQQCITEEKFGGNFSGDLDTAMPENESAAFNDGTIPLLRRQSSIQPQLMGVKSAPSSRASFTLSSIPEENSMERLKELQRRNTRTLPHLKSSYPVELQMQSPSISDERIKEGTQSTNGRLRGGRPQSMQFDIPNDESLLKRKLSRDKGDPSVGSPMATRRRLSVPHTPSAPVQEELEHPPARRLTMMSSGMKLREFLDEKENVKRPDVSREQLGSGTSFDVSFSSDGAQKPIQLPKRLAQRQEARALEKSHPAKVVPATPAAVGVSKKAPAKSQPPRAQKVLTSTN